MRKSSRRKVLTLKDICLLRYLHAVKASTYKRINRDIFPEYHPKSIPNLIYHLEANNLVSGCITRQMAGGERVISLTNKGFKNFIKNGDEKRIELKSDAVEHDLGLVDIRCRLLMAKRTESYHTENEIQTWGGLEIDEAIESLLNLNSDAIVQLKFSDGPIYVPLEYEIHAKSKAKYISFVKKIYQRNDVFFLLFICGDESILRKVKNIEINEIKNRQPKFLYKLKQDFFLDSTLEFSNCIGDSLRLDAY